MSKALEDVVVLELTTEFWSAVGAAMLVWPTGIISTGWSLSGI